MTADQTYVTEFADLARALGAAGEESDRLMLAVDAAVELIPGLPPRRHHHQPRREVPHAGVHR